MQKPIQKLTALLISLVIVGAVNAQGAATCAQIFLHDKVVSTLSLKSVSVSDTLSLSISSSSNARHVPEGYVYVDGIKVPRVAKNSKWRAVVIQAKTDNIDTDGYLSGAERNTGNIPEWQRSKYKDATGTVLYKFADRSVWVDARTARALEFSYLDSVNPSSPKNSTVVGIHDDLQHIVNIVRQAGAEILSNPEAYIRIDEISTEGLVLTSAEQLYQSHNLSHPRYSPKGEWVSDGSIPPNNIQATYKFKVVQSHTQLRDHGRFNVGDEVYYTAINGEKYLGRIAKSTVMDGFVTLAYVDKYGARKFDLSRISDLRPTTGLDSKRHFNFQAEDIHLEIKRNPIRIEKIIDILSSDVDLRRLYESSAGVSERYSIREHTIRVFNTFLEFQNFYPELNNFRTSDGSNAMDFLAKVIATHDIGKSRAAANSGIAHQHEYTRPLARKILQQLGMSDKDLDLAEAIIKHDDFGRVFNKRLTNKMSPAELVESMRSKVAELGISLKYFFSLNLAFFLADAGSYPVVREKSFFINSAGWLVPKDQTFEEVLRLIRATGG